MTTKDQALKLALEALKELRMLGMNMQWHDSWLAKSETAITAIREALAEESHCDDCGGFDPECPLAQPAQQQEPVAWGNLANWCLDSDRVLITHKDEAAKYHRDVYDLTPLYTSPPASKPWVGLTDEERNAILDREFKQWWSRHDAVCRAIEAKLREKNA